MCGIIGRIGRADKSSKTIDSLKELEYRGYDSHGILFSNLMNGGFSIQKKVGVLNESEIFELKKNKSNLEIGHTRWSTHGETNEENAHPHSCMENKFHIVANGIVENYIGIKQELISKGFEFKSQTDTEIISQLYLYYFNKTANKEISLIDLSKKVLSRLKGQFSFLLNYENSLIAYKNVNPLIVGQSNEEFMLSSDCDIIRKNCNEFTVLEDGELVELTFVKSEKDSQNIQCIFYDSNFKQIQKYFENSNYKEESNNFEKQTVYFMEKEILEQKNIKNLMTKENLRSFDHLQELIPKKKIFICGAGTSFNAGLNMHYSLLEQGIFSSTIIASELENYETVIMDSLIIVFSQSGETADLISPLKKLSKNNEIFTITNSKNSTLDRLADYSIHLNCGKEVAVASTKAFIFQMMISEILFNKNFDFLSFENLFDQVIEKNKNNIPKICEDLVNSSDFFFLGRNDYYPLAIEGALKLKEISYIHAEGFAGGELKHGTLALIAAGVPTVVLGNSLEIISNAIEIKSRGGIIIGISDKYNEIYDYFLEIPKDFSKIFSTILMQIIAFEMAILRGNNPDRPRNLAKSVTVK